MLLTILEEFQSDFCKNLTKFYQISLKNLPYLTDFNPQLMACMQTPNVELHIQLSMSNSVLYSTSQCRALYSVLQVYIEHYIQHPNEELYIRLCMSIFSTIFNIRMQSSIFCPAGLFSTAFKLRMQNSIFGSPCLYSAIYSNFECRALYSALQVYIQHSIQHPNAELYIRSSRSIFSTIFKLQMQSATFGSPGLYSALYSISKCRTPYSVLLVYFQHYHTW